MRSSTNDPVACSPREYVSYGYRVHRQIIVRDLGDRSKTAATINVGPQTRITFRFRGKPRHPSHRHILARLKLVREREALRSQLWREYADPILSAESSIASSELVQQLQEVERLLSRIASLTGRARAARLQPQTLCGSRPYFPAAPP
jgi:hypothetical protein